MGKLACGALVALLGFLGSACGQADDHPKNFHPVSGGTGGGGFGGGSSASGGVGGDCDPDPAKGPEIRGDVITYDAFLSDVQPFNGQCELRIKGSNCPWSTTTWDGTLSTGPDGGTNLFVLEGVKALYPSYTHIYQLPSSQVPVYPTQIAVDATKDQEILGGFGMVRSAAVDEIYTATGTTRDPDKATIIVKVFGQLGPLAGVQVDVGTAGAAAYPGLGGWQLGGETDPAGVAVMLNVTAKPFPGQSWTTNLGSSSGSSKESFSCPAEAGMVTICLLQPTSGF